MVPEDHRKASDLGIIGWYRTTKNKVFYLVVPSGSSGSGSNSKVREKNRLLSATWQRLERWQEDEFAFYSIFIIRWVPIYFDNHRAWLLDMMDEDMRSWYLADTPQYQDITSDNFLNIAGVFASRLRARLQGIGRTNQEGILKAISAEDGRRIGQVVSRRLPTLREHCLQAKANIVIGQESLVYYLALSSKGQEEGPGSSSEKHHWLPESDIPLTEALEFTANAIDNTGIFKRDFKTDGVTIFLVFLNTPEMRTCATTYQEALEILVADLQLRGEEIVYLPEYADNADQSATPGLVNKFAKSGRPWAPKSSSSSSKSPAQHGQLDESRPSKRKKISKSSSSRSTPVSSSSSSRPGTMFLDPVRRPCGTADLARSSRLAHSSLCTLDYDPGAFANKDRRRERSRDAASTTSFSADPNRLPRMLSTSPPPARPAIP
ncbi:hypothetical protein IAU59_007646 [Kwoniella sp. CBS 9459]